MAIFTKRIDDVNEQDLQELVDQKFAESKTVEYKERLSVGSESDRKKFLSQVSSFANAAGGHLIYGVRAADGVPEEVAGLEIANPDGELLRLEDMIRAGVRPRIPGLQIKTVTVKTDKVAIVIRIPKSWARPHQVVFNGEYRFYSRASNGKYVVDVDELRRLFVLSESAAERIRNFRADRIGQLIAGETPVQMDENAKLVLHVVPLGAFDPATKFDLSAIRQETGLLMPMRTGGGWSGARHNFDGLYTHADHNGLSYSYVQVFRNGIVEMVNTSLLDPKYDGRKIIPSVAYEDELRQALKRCLVIERKLGAEPPFVIMLSLLGVKDYVMAVSQRRSFNDGHPIDRDMLVVPESLIETFEAPADKTLRPILDAVWNATGWPGTINFDEEDNWKPHE